MSGDNGKAAVSKGNPQEAMTIKGIPLERREAITAAADRLKMTNGEFILMLFDGWLRQTREPMPPGTALVPANHRETPTPYNGIGSLIEDVRVLASIAPTKGNGTLLAAARKALQRRLLA